MLLKTLILDAFLLNLVASSQWQALKLSADKSQFEFG